MSATIDIAATERVLKARGELIMSRRFYGVLVSHVEPVLSRDFPTMATNGKQHFFNPEFVCSLTAQELLAVQAHETEHDARHHGTRRDGRNPEQWNIACDYAINVDLVDEGFRLPAGALIDRQYKGMSAEDIYRSRELDAQKAPKPKPDNDNGQGEGDDGAQDGPQDGAEGDGDQGTQGQQEASQPATSGDPGQCGEVLDAAPQGEGNAAVELDTKWERIVRQAASMARAVGQCPGHITREIERANNPARDWRDELREFCEQGSQRLETWNRPNRRHVGRGLTLPGSQKYGIAKAAFVIDTSGSYHGPQP